MKNNIEQLKPKEDKPNKTNISLKPEDMTGKFQVDDVKKKEAVQEKAKKVLIECLLRGSIYYKEESLEDVDHVRPDGDEEDDGYNDDDSNDDWHEPKYDIPDRVKLSPEVQEAARDGVAACLLNGDVASAIKIKNGFALPVEVISSPEQMKALKEEMVSRASSGNIEGVEEIVAEFFPPDGSENSAPFKSPETEEALKEVLINLLSDGYIDRAVQIKEKLSLSAEVVSSPEVQKAVRERILDILSGDCLEPGRAIKLKDVFSFPDEEMHKVGKEGMMCQLSGKISHESYRKSYSRYSSNYWNALKIKDALKLPDEVVLSPEIQEAAKVEVAKLLSNGSVDHASNVLEKFSLPASILASPEIQSAAKSAIINCLYRNEYGDIDTVLNIKSTFAVFDENFASTEVQNAAREIMVIRLSEGDYNYIDAALSIKEKFLLSPENVQEAARKGMENRLRSGQLDDVNKIRETFSVPSEFNSSVEILDAAGSGLIKCLSKGEIEKAVKIKDQFSIPSEFLTSPEVQHAAKIFITNEMSKGHINEARKTQGQFAVSPELMQQAAKEGMMTLLCNGNIYEASNVRREFSFTLEIISSAEVQEATKKGVVRCLVNGTIESALEMQEKFLLPVEAVIQTAKEEMIKDLLSGTNKIDIAVRIKNGFHFSAEIISSAEVQKAAKEGMIAWILNGSVDGEYFSRIDAIRKEFSIPTDFITSKEVQGNARARLVKCLSVGNIDYALKLGDVFSLSNDDTEKAAVEGMLARLTSPERGDKLIDDAIKIKDSFYLSAEACQKVAKEAMAQKLVSGGIEYSIKIQEQFALSVEDISDACKKAFLKCLTQNKTETAEKIREKFKVSVNSEDIFNVIPEMRTLLSSLRDISPEFVAQAEKTPDLLLSLLEFRSDPDRIINVAKENPFLLDAIANNPRFGSRLLIKYRQFDKLSKENIKTQFAYKMKIMAEHPEIDPQSVEFRMLMQESLKGFGKNKEVIEAIDETGISSERWLNYDETAYFNLGSSENTLAFSEVITTPIARIKETIDTYAYTIKDVLKEYRDELLKFEIKLGASEAPTEDLQKMMGALEKARLLPADWKDKNGKTRDKVIFGIEKGIENLKSKLTQERKGVLWDKLLADVASFQRLKDDVFKSQEIFVATENELRDSLAEKTPSGKRIQEIKRKISAAKEDLRSKFVIMERRIEDFRTNLKSMIAPALGNERTDALIQEINTKLAEQFNHFDADRSMLKNLFSPQSNKTKEEMESRPMSIFVWTRDPDIDLYQGNYSPCCICIDSTYHGAESPIADYNTDLGIQIVNIWDETKNEPITAAWCWLGEDENGKPALVVDNIESNTLFSAHFSEQLTKELFSYLEGYAKAIGVKKIVLGKAHNDMPTAGELSKMPDNDKRYSKIGGANRSDGYYLEAEGVNVKIVWEKGKKVNAKKEEAGQNKSSIEGIVFDEVNVQALVEQDFGSMRDLERRAYENDAELIQGQELVQDIKSGNGLEYSVATWGMAPGSAKREMIAYAVAVDDETDEGDKSVYLEDIAVAPEAQRQGIGWKLIQEMVKRLQVKASSGGKPVLFDMHLRPSSLSMFDAPVHREEFARIGITQIEDVLVPDYYDEGEDAVYRVYEITPINIRN